VDLVTFPIGETVEIPGVRYHRGSNAFRIRSVPIGFSLRKVILDLGLLPVVAELVRSNRYDFIHAVEEAAFPAVLLGKRLKVPVIYDMQSSLPEQLAQRRFFRAAPVALPLAAAERWLLRRADAIKSWPGLKSRVLSVVPEARVEELRQTASPPVPNRDASEVRTTLGVDREAPLLVYTGTLEAYQGVDHLVGAVARCLPYRPDLTLLLVGASPEEERAVTARALALGAADALRILPRCSRSEIADYVAAADVLVSARSYGANIPLKVSDYLAAGRPILATDIPAHRAVLDQTRAMLVPSGERGLAEGILALVNDPTRSARLAKAAKEYADSHLGWEAYVLGLDATYQSLARARRLS